MVQILDTPEINMAFLITELEETAEEAVSYYLGTRNNRSSFEVVVTSTTRLLILQRIQDKLTKKIELAENGKIEQN